MLARKRPDLNHVTESHFSRIGFPTSSRLIIESGNCVAALNSKSKILVLVLKALFVMMVSAKQSLKILTRPSLMAVPRWGKHRIKGLGERQILLLCTEMELLPVVLLKNTKPIRMCTFWGY
jgi:hypothetical protein